MVGLVADNENFTFGVSGRIITVVNRSRTQVVSRIVLSDAASSKGIGPQNGKAAVWIEVCKVPECAKSVLDMQIA